MEITRDWLLMKRQAIESQRVQAARQVQVLTGSLQMVDDMIAAVENKPTQPAPDVKEG